MSRTTRLLVRIVAMALFSCAVIYQLSESAVPGSRLLTFMIFMGVAAVWQQTASPRESEDGAPLGETIQRTSRMRSFVLAIVATACAVYAMTQGYAWLSVIGLLVAAFCLTVGAIETVLLRRNRQDMQHVE